MEEKTSRSRLFFVLPAIVIIIALAVLASSPAMTANVINSIPFRDCIIIYDGIVITQSANICEGEYILTETPAIIAQGDQIKIDCFDAKLYHPVPETFKVFENRGNDLTLKDCELLKLEE